MISNQILVFILINLISLAQLCDRIEDLEKLLDQKTIISDDADLREWKNEKEQELIQYAAMKQYILNI